MQDKRNIQMEQLRLAQLKIAKEIKRICEKNNINYFLDAGSMLGAVRHKGFIPWDDDMDIGMLDEEYKKFLEIAPKELGEEFFLDNYYLNKEYGLVFSKVRLKNTKYVEKLGATDSSHQEIFVDVFPYFYRPENKIERKIQSSKLRILAQIFMAQSGFHVWRGNKGISKAKFIPIIMLSKITKKDNIYRKIEKLYNQCDKSDIVGVHDGICYNYWHYDKKYLENFIDMNFENEYFKIPKEYDKILKTVYGDYMTLPPIEERKTHEIIELDLGNHFYN
jgi:lipopolysaccharide cholinephosphotransferase